MCSLQMFIKIGTIKSLIKLDVEDRINQGREVRSGLANEVDRAALLNKDIVITLAIGESTVV